MVSKQERIDRLAKEVFELGIKYIPHIVGYEGDIAEYLINKDYHKVIYGKWTGMDGDRCSVCGHYLSDIMDADSFYAIGFDIKQIVACPFCGAIMEDDDE
jgi:hypothetical protein